MSDLKGLSPPALSAAMRGGTAEWGSRANALEHVRYAEPLNKIERVGGRTFYPTRCKCHCGCGGRKSHIGMTNGIGLMSGCELSVRRWVRDPLSVMRRRPAENSASQSTEGSAREAPDEPKPKTSKQTEEGSLTGDEQQ